VLENPSNTLHDWRITFCGGCPHYACGFEMGRLTPCLFKVLLSAKGSRPKHEISAPLSGLLAVALSSPHPRPWSVRARSQSATTTAVCPCPRLIHVRDLSANMSAFSP